nr:hypothetical protein [Tanacetum cinerariifolium]
MKNHESRPTGYASLSEANVVTYNQSGGRGHGSDRERGRGRGCGRGQGRRFGRVSYVVPYDGLYLQNMDRVAQLIINDEDICLVDSATTHTILKKEKYLSRLNLQESNVNTVFGSAKLTKAANAPVKIDVPKENSDIANEFKARPKRGRPIGSKDKNPRKKRGACNPDGVMENDEDHEPNSVLECKNRYDGPKWKDAIEVELKSLEKHEVFGLVVRTPEDVKLVGCKWVAFGGTRIFPKTRSGPEYVIIAVYVDDLNIIGTPNELPKAVEYLKKEFEMKD